MDIAAAGAITTFADLKQGDGFIWTGPDGQPRLVIKCFVAPYSGARIDCGVALSTSGANELPMLILNEDIRYSSVFALDNLMFLPSRTLSDFRRSSLTAAKAGHLLLEGDDIFLFTATLKPRSDRS